VKHLSKHHDELQKAVTERLLDSNLTEQLDLTAASDILRSKKIGLETASARPSS
jgi:hypothetical protein